MKAERQAEFRGGLPAASSSAQGSMAKQQFLLQEQAKRRRYLVAVWIGIIVVGVVAMVGWELSRFLVDPFWASAPSLIAAKLLRWTLMGDILFHLGVTLAEMALGLISGSVLGVVLGFLLGSHDYSGRVFGPYFSALYTLPTIALVPLIILWFGIGFKSKAVVIAFIVFFYLYQNTFTGVREVDRRYADVVRIMGGSAWDLISKVILPSASAWIFAGLKLAVPRSLAGAVVAEMMASNKGIGYLVSNAANMFDSTGVFAGLFVIMIVAVFLNWLVGLAEGYTRRWRV